MAFATTAAILALVPWTVHAWPSQDGPNHLAVTHILAHYADAGSPFPKYFDVERGLKPSTATYTLLALLSRSLSLPTAEKLLVSVAIILAPVSLLFLLQRSVPRRRANALLALPFAIGWALAMGFLSFVLAMAFGVLTLSLGWAQGPVRRAGWWGPVLAAATLSLSLWFHPVAAVEAGLALLLLEGRNLGRPSEWPRLVLVVSPAALLLALSYAGAHAAPPTSGPPPQTHFADPLSLVGGVFEYHLAYTPWELVPRAIAVAVLVRFAWSGMRTFSPLGATAEGALTRVVLCFLALYCVTPLVLGGWFYASTRFLLFASLLLPAAAEIPPRTGRRLLAIAPALTAAVLVVQWPDLRASSVEMRDVVDVGASLPRGAKIVPMDFMARLMGPQPLAHAWAGLVVERDAVASQIFAAGKPGMGGESFRTLSFRSGVLDEATGILPWSTSEGWNDVVRKCSTTPLIAWLQSGKLGCEAILAERKATLDAVLDRYDYILMLDPPDYARALVASRTSFVDRRGAAWLFRVTTATGAPPP